MALLMNMTRPLGCESAKAPVKICEPALKMLAAEPAKDPAAIVAGLAADAAKEKRG